MASRFGEMLLNRRREMGLSIQQVANTIKMRPQIIEYFETGNFAAMPPRGYAQGMISSYARFLGLNPREVVGAYFDELYVFERTGESAGSRFAEGASEPVPRSSSSAGRFMMVDTQLPSSRFGQRPPQAGYVSDTTSGHVPMRVAGNERRAANLPPARPVRSGFGRPGSHAADRPSYGLRRDARPTPSERSGRALGSARPYREGSSGRDGQLGRPVRAQGASGRASGGPRGPVGRGGSRGGSRAPLYDPRLLIGALGLIAVLLVLVVVLLVRSCSTAPAADKDAAATPAVTEQTASTPQGDEDKDADDASASTSSASTGSSSDPATVEQVKVTVSIADGESSFVEVKVDGTYAYSHNAVGPFSMEFTPAESLEITASEPSAVKVTKNGEKLSWDTKTSGVAKLTVTVPKPVTTQAATDGSADDGTTDDSSASASA